ncbi:AAA family ATPase [Lentinula raphanica]|uniref:AAA family ATPase n=1 Tax=Lentinula raphanica TaxID=153919 RepID=A0AA38P2Z0_9AGAR|nr:AAA family ATPase [Lentinula raphanica]
MDAESLALKLPQLEEKIKLLEEKLAALEAKHGETPTANGTKSDGTQTDEKKSNTEGESTESAGGSRARIVINRRDDTTGDRKDFPVEDPAASAPGSKATTTTVTYAFLLRKFVYFSEEPTSELEITGIELRNLLKGLLRHYPYHIFIGETVSISSPYECLVLNWDLLEEEARKQGTTADDQIARNDLKLLLETISDTSDPKLEDYFWTRPHLKETESITFDTLWTIFPPGTLVHATPFLKLDQLFIVQDYQTTWPNTDNARSKRQLVWRLDCWTYDWNGQFFQRYGITLEIEYFEGFKPISALSVRPFNSVDNRAAIKKRLIERGELFRKYCTTPKDSRMFKYSGKAFLDKSGFRGVTSGYDDGRMSPVNNSDQPKQSTVFGDVMVDFESYYKHGLASAQIAELYISEDTTECKCTNCASNDALQNNFRTRFDGFVGDLTLESWEEEQLMLCPPRVLGYVLREKKWAQLDVNSVILPTHKGEADAFWDKLILAGEDGGKETKAMLHGLIKNHGRSEKETGYHLNDIVAEKGQGLVILLYGPPGVGKTSTAQTIASAARKPLFSIGVADVGTAAGLVESNLETIFDLATTWKAVLLIDEADVFLQSRARGQMGPTTERNALVSVFLRVLEYYQGILILTTNQIAQFDVAVQSRIHIAIRYEGLDKKQTVSIFRGFLEQYKARGLVQPQTFKKIMDWVERDLSKRKFDGRQIRNIVTSSMGIALADEERETPGLTIEDLQSVVAYMANFKGDLEYQMRAYEDAQSGARAGYS